MTDKSKELSTAIKLVNDRLHFMGSSSDNQPVSIDYTAPLGDDLGYTSLELLLLSLSSCLGSAMLTFLRRMNRTINGFEIRAKGLRKEEHPTGFKRIHLDIYLASKDVTEEEVKKVIDLAEDKYCPVWSMMKGNTIIETSIALND
ncbi:MAG: OsmC family protein [Bacteroidales bacterium]|nr:OsmC family protein [Lentimicrobiaceae bacterium]MDD5695671.1 OsmC family protein [Bacteroidales bacterium]